MPDILGAKDAEIAILRAEVGELDKNLKQYEDMKKNLESLEKELTSAKKTMNDTSGAINTNIQGSGSLEMRNMMTKFRTEMKQIDGMIKTVQSSIQEATRKIGELKISIQGKNQQIEALKTS